MAKPAKNEYTVTGVISKSGQPAKEYVCTWTYAKPLTEWSVKALAANVELGLKYAIKQKIKNQVLEDERTVERSVGILDGMLRLAQGDPEQLKIVAIICKEQNIRTEVQTEYIIHEDGYMTAPEPPAEGEEDGSENVGTGEVQTTEPEPVAVTA